MTSKEKTVPLEFDDFRLEDIMVPESKHEILSNILNTRHNSQAEIETSLEELRLYILKHHLTNSTQVGNNLSCVFQFLLIMTVGHSRNTVPKYGKPC
jgi:hypothetical protein